VTTEKKFNLKIVHPSWHACLHEALMQLDPACLHALYHDPDWLPGPEKIFAAFSVPVSSVNWILFGESPYPRKASANGYAFWDNAVGSLWSETGLERTVNRATSLRNLVKLLLITESLLDPENPSQTAIAGIRKTRLVKTCSDLFGNFLRKGFLLLNATPVLRKGQVKEDARNFHPFLKTVLQFLAIERPGISLILWGNMAKMLIDMPESQPFTKIISEHPYNLSFLKNRIVFQFFQPLHLILL
jgi:uracil-DNA glycosylase